MKATQLQGASGQILPAGQQALPGVGSASDCGPHAKMLIGQ